MAYNNIKFVNEDGIGILTISRPKALNALNTETVTELNDCVGKIEADESVKVVIITGEGAKSFVAGADIVEMSTKNPVEGRKFGKISQDTFTRPAGHRCCQRLRSRRRLRTRLRLRLPLCC